MPNQTLHWKEYSSRFAEQAEHLGFSPKYIAQCLSYALYLHERGLPIIYDGKHFCQLVGYRSSYVFAVSNSPERFYRHFKISKKNGGLREIAEPLPSLKEIQRWILDNILTQVPVSRFAKAFLRGESIKTNAKFHRKQPLVIGLDVKDFFGSIHTLSVFKLFRNLRYNNRVSMLLANICTLNDSLPQGAPTSPAISNIFMNNFDSRIASFCVSRKIRYTRYADDLTFSGNVHAGWIIRFVRKALSDCGLTLNDSKTRVLTQAKQQRVTGVVVNEKLQAPRDLRRKLRQEVYYIRKFGLSSHLNFKHMHFGRHIDHLMGIANYIIFLNRGDKEAIAALEYLRAVRQSA